MSKLNEVVMILRGVQIRFFYLRLYYKCGCIVSVNKLSSLSNNFLKLKYQKQIFDKI